MQWQYVFRSLAFGSRDGAEHAVEGTRFADSAKWADIQACHSTPMHVAPSFTYFVKHWLHTAIEIQVVLSKYRLSLFSSREKV